MARTKEQKKEITAKLTEIMNAAKTMVFVNIHGLKVGDATKMRRELTKNKVGLFVAKKSLTKRVLGEKKFAGDAPELVGEFALAYGEDVLAPARGVYEFEKKFKDQVSIVGGVFENKYLNKSEMTAIATIPPIETLYGMFANVVNSPIQGLVMVLDGIAKKKV